VTTMGLLVCVGVEEEGFREVLAVEVAGSQKGAAYAWLLGGLVHRGLSGVRLVISDEHEGIKAAVSGELPGAEWQRCTVHFERNVLSHVPTFSVGEVALITFSIYYTLVTHLARNRIGGRSTGA
jgi:putative transposase